ncbi:HAD-IC family P-type ATPase [Pseudoflavonifractor sp. MSJ-30]|uniref:HAD-IC family P-type ATPase n=1 Tax=Pseudoflavonifractor sp. MSJ-30 TaxID=2841525 RepID=UPI001C0FE743|nr:HAD-IC family P-type ATPase [Pseudoflavonifractor sp. MSJ-30]MBU5453672.1 HAD-IC family P-type ATPase [Pseudoflavonifractor sp. MSJ-30]
MDEEIELLHTDPVQGLTSAQAEQHIAEGLGAGQTGNTGKSEKEIILRHTLTFFNLVFIVLAVLLIVGKSTVMNMGFLGVVVVNTVIGIFQEIRAKRAVDKLSLVARRPVKIVRDGRVQDIAPEDIVRDDIAEFGQGDQICADGILRSGSLYVDESLLTGEEDSVEKQPGDQIHSGSVVLAGRGRVELTAVGENCGAAALAREAKHNPQAKKSEMTRSLDRLILFLGLALVPVGIILFRQEYMVLKLPLRESTEGTVAALVGMIPEGLYLLTSVALAVSAQKLSKSRVLVQDMNSIEALARVDVLCVDKTGTITEPDMEVENLLPLGDALLPEQLEDILTAMYDSGEPDNATAKAMQELFAGESDLKCTNRVPFSSEYKWSGCEFEESGSYVVGAPEFLLGDREDIWNIGDWAEKGYRVLLVARYDGPLAPGKLDAEKVEPMALALLTGKLRPNAKETFAYFAQQGVTVKVISGDNPATVSMIAQQAGIPDSDRYVDAATLETPEQLREAALKYTVFGRVTPQQKKGLIEALQKKKHTVAMTGDGVNDLLAMKQADCAVAMASGAEAASQLASLVLLDSDFSAMPGVVNEGRRVINNIQRAAALFLVKNIFSLFLSVISLFTVMPYPLEPIHLSVISAMTIGIPSFILTFEPKYDRVKGRFLPGVLRRAFPGGLTNVFVVLLCQVFALVFSLPQDEVSTICAAILSFVGLLVLYQICKPFNWFRRLLWWLMAAGIVLCFTLLGDILDLRTWTDEVRLVMFTLLVMTPTVFLAIQRVFDRCEQSRLRLAAWCRGLWAKRPFRKKKA